MPQASRRRIHTVYTDICKKKAAIESRSFSYENVWILAFARMTLLRDYFTLAVSNLVIAATYSAGFGSGEPSASNAWP